MTAHQLRSGDIKAFVFLQVDLAGHTPWVRKAQSLVSAFNKRKEFAELLKIRLEDNHRFERVFWAGDGGLFARAFSHAEDAEATCQAADTIFSTFTQTFTNGADLALRVSATCISQVLVDRNAGYWLSPDLNDFLKYERKIASHNAFVVTDRLRGFMNGDSDSFRRFAKYPGRNVLLDDRSITVFTDANHPASVPESPDRFSEWLTKQHYPYVDTTKSVSQGWQIDDSIVTGTALETTGYSSISLVQVDREWRLDDLFGERREEWEKLTKDYLPFGGTKASIARIQHPLSEEPVLRLEWRAIPFYMIKAFHDLLEGDPRFYDAYRSYAAKDTPREIPSNFVIHSLVILQSSADSRHLLLAHRKRRESGYYANCWSVSFEEQYAPVKSFWGDRDHPADETVNDTVTRGIKEEFLGEHFTGEINVGLHAVQLESRNLNIGMLATATVEVSFDEFSKLWPTAVDREEHDAILALPFEQELIDACIASDVLPEVCRIYPNLGVAALLDDDDHKWHPTVKARLALAKWLLDVGG